MEKKIVYILGLLVLLVTSCRGGTPAQLSSGELTHIRLPMGYIPNVQYAPFYTAVEKGFFTDAGIELEFDYSYETDGVALVGAGELPFSIVSGEQVPIARAEGLPIVYVMAWYEKYPVAVISRTEQKILKPEDLAGKQVGLPGLFGANYVGLRALLGEVNLKESDLILQSVGFNQVEILAAGTSDAIVGYIANEPVQLSAQGYDLNLILVADYLDLVSNGLISNEKTISENPDLVQRMVSAALKGIQYTVENPEEAFDICKKYVEGLEDADQEVQMEVLLTSIALYQTDPYGYSQPEAWSNMQDVLIKMDLMKKEINLEDAYTNEFSQ
ncbi:MAG: ABC transporter substrate-binding protein [Anaerolineales bacterium]|nr:ABC transporter substrate-binding protein [Anaerolineales bacterium]